MRKIILLFLSATLLPLFTLAAVQQATIITRPGVVTAPIKYYFDLSSTLSEGVNQGVKVTVSASNSEKTAVRFDSVKLFDQSGATVGNNVASKTDALTANPYGFTFDNFGVAPADLAKVAGVQITFMDLGGENPTGKVTIQSVAVSVIRDTGEACVIIDPIVITTPPPPIPTITQIQSSRPLVQPGTHGDGGSGGSGGGSGASQGPTELATVVDYCPSSCGGTWGSGAEWYTSTAANSPSSYLKGTGTGFSVPTGATINGIILTISKRGEGLSGEEVSDSAVRLIKNAVLAGESKHKIGIWPTSAQTFTYGGSGDVWGLSLTPADVNSLSDFGAAINITGGTTGTGYINSMKMTVYYTPLGGSVYDSFMDLIRAFFGKIR